jgi:UDPglucose 6-dehydrogenase
MKTIAIVGCGYVGTHMLNFLRKAHESVCVVKALYDPPYLLAQSAPIGEVNACDIAFVCVPTPTEENGDQDLSILREIFVWIKCPTVCIRSTVLPGTCRRLMTRWMEGESSVVFAPEFIGERNFLSSHPYEDGPPFLILGVTDDLKKAQEVADIFRHIHGPELRVMLVDSRTAELVKYMENAFLATKVTFCNVFKILADSVGVDYNVLREAWLMDGRMGRSHTIVTDERGFGGKCLPKDLLAIAHFASESGLVLSASRFLHEVLTTNNNIQGLRKEELKNVSRNE